MGDRHVAPGVADRGNPVHFDVVVVRGLGLGSCRREPGHRSLTLRAWIRMKTITRTVVTVEVIPERLAGGVFTVHEALLDGDENLQVGTPVLVHDGDVTYYSAEVTAPLRSTRPARDPVTPRGLCSR